MNWVKLGIFAGGVAFGSVGLKLLGSKDAKKVYAQVTAATLRAKESVCLVYTSHQLSRQWHSWAAKCGSDKR